MTSRHVTALLVLALVALVGVAVSAAQRSLWGVVTSVSLGVVLTFVLGVAWTRFRGESTEHHPQSDALVDDTEP